MQTWAGGSTGKAENALTKGPIDNVDYNITLMWVIQDQELSAGVPTSVSTPLVFVVTVGSMQELAVVVALVVGINIAENFGSMLFCYIFLFSSGTTTGAAPSWPCRAECSTHPPIKFASLLFRMPVHAASTMHRVQDRKSGAKRN